jgi:hypothetical protein
MTSFAPQVVDRLASLLESPGRASIRPRDWRLLCPPSVSHAQEGCPLLAFDTACVLAEHNHRRGDIETALTWAIQGIWDWHRLAGMGRLGGNLDVSAPGLTG